MSCKKVTLKEILWPSVRYRGSGRSTTPHAASHRSYFDPSRLFRPDISYRIRVIRSCFSANVIWSGLSRHSKMVEDERESERRRKNIKAARG